MTTTTPNMSLVLPDEGGSADVWGGLLNQIFALIDSHSHAPGLGVRIPAGALKIDADVSWASSGTNYSITDAKAIDFTPQAPANVTSYSSALWVSSADNNLYFRNSLGTNVQITSGSTINVSIVGGIGGDYASVGALVDYDDANDTYRFRQETSASVRQFAKVATADLVLREYRAAGNAVVPVNAVTVKSPTALASAYTVTLPSALPGATSLLRMTSAGVVDLTSAIDQDVAFASNRKIQLQGTGYVALGDATDFRPFYAGAAWSVETGSAPAYPGVTPDRITVPTNSTVYFPLNIGNSRRRVKSVTVYGRSLTDATTLGLFTSSGMGTATLSPGSVTLTGATTSTTLVVAADGLFNARTMTLQTPTTYATGLMLWVRVATTATGSMVLNSYAVTYDVP